MALPRSGNAPQTASPFVWGQGGRKLTPEQVAREREIAAALMKSGADYSPVGHWAQGLARVANAGVGAFKDWQASEAEEAGLAGARNKYSSEIAALLGGGAPIQTASIDPVAAALTGAETATDAVNAVGAVPATAVPQDSSDFRSGLIQSESGGNWAAQNDAVGSGGKAGHYGRVQFGHARLQDAMNAGAIPPGTTPEQFMASPKLQQAAEDWHFADIDQQSQRMGLNSYYGQTVGGVPINADSIRAMAHLGGIGGAQKFITSGGEYNPADANGTRLSDYGSRFGGGASAAAPVRTAQAGGISPAILEALSDPWAKELYGPVLNAALSQQIQQQDPRYQLELEAARQGLTKTELEIQQLLAPPAETPMFEGTGMDAQAWNILQTASPDSKEYATAYSIIAQPKPQMVQTEQGMMLVPVAPQLPAWLAPPGGAAAPPIAPSTPPAAGVAPALPPEAPLSMGAAPQQPVSVPSPAPAQVGAGQIIPGTRKPSTEGQQRNEMLGTVLTSDLQTINDSFDALADPAGQLLGKIPGGLGNPWQSEQYQQAANAVSSSVSNILYSVSGASANPGELENQVRNLTPQLGDKPGTIADKKRRLNTFVNAVAGASGNPELIAKAREESIRGMGESSNPAAGAPQGQSQPPVITQQDYQALPSGSPFIAADDPTRTVRIKP